MVKISDGMRIKFVIVTKEKLAQISKNPKKISISPQKLQNKSKFSTQESKSRGSSSQFPQIDHDPQRVVCTRTNIKRKKRIS